MKQILILLLFLNISASLAQTKLKGTVIDADSAKKPVAGAIITAREKTNGKTLGFGSTDNSGKYELSFESKSDSIQITVSGFSIKKQTAVILNTDQLLNFDVVKEDITLKEVKIKPPRISRLGDTLTYDVNSFSDQNDRTIGDVLKKMPGIKVAGDGSITYNDKKINRFYIENLDLLQGRYGIATNNVEAKDVMSVQVLENHQPIKVLKDKEISDEAAINLKLRESAKGVFVANTQLGAGISPALWNNELTSTYFGKHKQNISTYKGNNTGDDSAGELANFYSGDGNLPFNTALYLQAPSSPPVARNRYLLNRDNAFSVNNLWSSKKGLQITANASYLNDTQSRASYQRSTYYLPGDSALAIEERMSSRNRLNSADASLQFNINREKFFMNNAIKFHGDLNEENGDVFNNDSIYQKRSAPLFKISNSFSLVKNHKKLTYRVSSYNGYSRLPQTLEIQPLLYRDLLPEQGAYHSLSQALTQEFFASYNNLSLGFEQGKWKQNYSTGLNASLQTLRSELSGQTSSGSIVQAADSLRNKSRWNRYDLYFNQKYTYLTRKIESSLDLPLTYSYFDTRRGPFTEGERFKRFFLTPNFNIIYNLNQLLKISASTSYDNKIGGIDNIYSGYILQSYRNLVRNDGRIPEQKSFTYSGRLEYRNVISEVFANVNFSHFRSSQNILYGNTFIGIQNVRQTFDFENYSIGQNFSASISKGFDNIIRRVSLKGGYTQSQNTSATQSQIVDYLNKTYFTILELGLNFKNKVAMDASGMLSENTNKIKNNAGQYAPIHGFTQNARLSIFPSKKLIINVSYDYSYNSSLPKGNQMMGFADAAVKWTVKKVQFTGSCNNIFNTRRYISYYFDATNSFYTSYDLRPSQFLLKARFKIK